MDLIRAHQMVEAGHRHDAYDMVLNYTPPALRQSVLTCVKKSLSLWLNYRDAVARACGINNSHDPNLPLLVCILPCHQPSSIGYRR